MALITFYDEIIKYQFEPTLEKLKLTWFMRELHYLTFIFVVVVTVVNESDTKVIIIFDYADFFEEKK